VALLAAARNRASTGQGREIQVPLSNVAFGMLSTLGNIGEVTSAGDDRPRYGNALFGSFGRDFVTADGVRLMLVAITARQWKGLLAALGLEAEVAALEQRHGVRFETDDGARFMHRDALFALVQARIGARSAAELAPVFDRNAVCWGPYQTVREALAQDPRLSAANPMFQPVAQPSGERYLAAGFPGILAGAARAAVRPAPRLGADTDEILAGELGLPAHEIGRLHDAGIVAGPAGEE
jgi:2-methylfumaryl-CoA isomerase